MIDYSATVNPPLDENTLSESGTSLCGFCAPPHSGHTVPIGPPGPWGWGYLESESAPGIDFDRDFVFPEPLIQADINWPVVSPCPDSTCDVPFVCSGLDTCPLQGADDWSNLVFWSSSSNYNTGVHGAVLPQGGEIDFETVKMLSFAGGCAWDTGFDIIEAGAELHGRMGWKGWDDDPAFGAVVTDVQANSADNSIEVHGATDLVHELCSDGFGIWSYSAWQYIPSDFASGGGGPFAGSWFILMDSYNDGGPYHWAAQLQFDANDGLLKVYDGVGDPANPGVPYVSDRWVKIQAIIDLDQDWTRVYYDDALVAEYSWTGGVLGGAGGILEIGAVDLFADGSSPVYYDDVRQQPVASECGPADLFFDADGDGLDLLSEFLAGTEPCNPDTDEDGVPDGFDNCPLVPNPTRSTSTGTGSATPATTTSRYRARPTSTVTGSPTCST